MIDLEVSIFIVWNSKKEKNLSKSIFYSFLFNMWYLNGQFEYIKLYEQKFIINTWFVEEYILQSFEKLKTLIFDKILEKRDVLIKSLYEVYVWSLWRVDFVGILKHIIFSQHQVLFGLFIDLDWLTFITFGMYVCMFIPYQHTRLVGWRPN